MSIRVVVAWVDLTATRVGLELVKVFPVVVEFDLVRT